MVHLIFTLEGGWAAFNWPDFILDPQPIILPRIDPSTHGYSPDTSYSRVYDVVVVVMFVMYTVLHYDVSGFQHLTCLPASCPLSGGFQWAYYAPRLTIINYVNQFIKPAETTGKGYFSLTPCQVNQSWELGVVVGWGCFFLMRLITGGGGYHPTKLTTSRLRPWCGEGTTLGMSETINLLGKLSVRGPWLRLKLLHENWRLTTYIYL